MSALLLEDIVGVRTFDLAHEYFVGMPQSPNHAPFRMVLDRRHGDMIRSDGGSAANEMIVLGCHVGTHIDALGHVSHDGKLHGGVVAQEAQTNKGLKVLSITEFEPFVGRGVLLDVARVHDVDCLPAGYEVTVEDLRLAQKLAGVELRAGDAVLIRTGWSSKWIDPGIFNGATDGAPGPGVDAAEWLAAKAPRVIGAETVALEHIPPGKGHSTLPVHRKLLVEHGIYIIEAMFLTDLATTQVSEFVFVVAPLAIAGATGSPVRPLAIVAA